MDLKSSDVLLVGSAPFETVEEAFKACATRVGDRVFALPDGEVGLRSTWVGALPHMTYEQSDDLEQIKQVKPEDVVSPDGHENLLDSFGLFRVKPGVTEPRFDLHFGLEAVKSYESFKKLRAEGVIPDGVRFQVCFPCTSDAIDLFFPEPESHAIMSEAYPRELQNSIALVLEHVPADDLAIQLDYCSEVLHCIGALDHYAPEPPPTTVEERFAFLTSREYLEPLSATIPDDVIVGYHLCFGTWGGWPIGRVLDIDLIVRLANAMVANTPRRIGYVHLPGMPDPPDDFFAPLGNLDIGDTKVFMGIELADGKDALMTRAAMVREHLPEFGIAHYCGYGRETGPRVREILDETRSAAQELAQRA